MIAQCDRYDHEKEQFMKQYNMQTYRERDRERERSFEFERDREERERREFEESQFEHFTFNSAMRRSVNLVRRTSDELHSLRHVGHRNVSALLRNGTMHFSQNMLLYVQIILTDVICAHTMMEMHDNWSSHVSTALVT